MNVLMLTDQDRDYAADYLAHGFVALGSRLVDYPLKPSLHWQQEQIFDCDVNLPWFKAGLGEVRDGLGDRWYDLIVVPTLRGSVPLHLRELRPLLKTNQDRLVYYDGEDHALNTLPLFVEAAGIEPAASFKRELPLGETWATPLPFGYPAERVVPVGTQRHRAIYAAHIWPWAVGELRGNLATALRGLPGVDVLAPHTPEERISIAEYHRRTRARAIAVSPAGQGWHTNRHAEIIADGCCPVLEDPWRQFPDAYVDGVHCRYFRNTMDAVDIVQELLDAPEQARAMAEAAQRHFLAHHTTRHRAATVWESIHGA